MRANSDVLIALAAYDQRWNYDEGLAVAERMRRDRMALRRAVVGIGLGMTCGYGKARVPSYMHEATSAYCLMRLRLLAFYRVSYSARYSNLANAVLAVKDAQNPPVLGYSAVALADRQG
jgi:hypothetical protein